MDAGPLQFSFPISGTHLYSLVEKSSTNFHLHIVRLLSENNPKHLSGLVCKQNSDHGDRSRQFLASSNISRNVFSKSLGLQVSCSWTLWESMSCGKIRTHKASGYGSSTLILTHGTFSSWVGHIKFLSDLLNFTAKSATENSALGFTVC
jgi:hypothetical protein